MRQKRSSHVPVKRMVSGIARASAGTEQLVAHERGDATDPELMSILNDIEVRAAVELAKLEMSGLVAPVFVAPQP